MILRNELKKANLRRREQNGNPIQEVVGDLVFSP
jgi:hypothetical protein